MQDTDFTTLTIHEIYRLRNWAGKVDNQDILSRIKAHLNARVGANGTYPFTQAETTLEEVLSQTPPEAWLIVDHQIVNTQETERYCHKFQKEVFDKFGERIKVSMCSGELPEEFHRDKHVVLLATRNGFCVLKARGTSTSGKVLVLGDEMKETGMTRGELNIIGKPTPQSKSRFFDEPAEWEAKEANTKEYVRLDRLMSIPESTTVLIQMTYQMDDANDRRVTRQVQQLVSDTLRAGLKPVITIVSLGSDQKDKMDLYLTNAVVLDVYPGCIIVSKARGDMGLKEVGKRVLLAKREDMGNGDYVIRPFPEDKTITLEQLVGDCCTIVEGKPIRFFFERGVAGWHTPEEMETLESFKAKVAELTNGNFVTTTDPMVNDIAIRIVGREVYIARSRASRSGIAVK